MPATTPADKPQLVLLPGLLCDAAVWHPQVEALRSLAQCHVVDYGTRHSLRAMAEEVLATAPARQFALAGHSMGGRVAFEVMRLAPQRVARLALMDTASHPLATTTGARRRTTNSCTRRWPVLRWWWSSTAGTCARWSSPRRCRARWRIGWLPTPDRDSRGEQCAVRSER